MPITPGSATKLNPVIGLSTALTLTTEDIADSAKMSKVLPKGILVSFPNGNVALTDGSTALNALNPIIDQLLTETEKLALLHTFSGTNETYRAVEGGFLVLGADGKMAPASLPANVWNTETGKILVSALPDSVRAGISVVADYTSLNTATDEQKRGLILVTDASGDETVDKGAALYQWLTDKNAFLKISEVESLDIDIAALRPNYQNIQAAGAIMYDHSLMLEPPSLTEMVALMEASLNNPGQPLETASYMEMLGSGGNFIFRIEDESQVVAYWNTNGGSDATFIEGGKPAFKLVLGPNADGMHYFYTTGQGSATGDIITWREVPQIGSAQTASSAERMELTEDLQLTNESPRNLVVSATISGIKIFLPDPTLIEEGTTFTFTNSDVYDIQLCDHDRHLFAASISRLKMSSSKSFTLIDKTTGTWSAVDLGNAVIGGRIGNTGFTLEPGVATIFESAETSYIDMAKISNTQYVVVYADGGNSGFGTAVLLTIDNDTIQVGTPFVFKAATVVHLSACALEDGRILIGYGLGNSGAVSVLSLSGSTLKVDATATFVSGWVSHVSVKLLTGNKAIVVYCDGANAKVGSANILTISASSIAVGAKKVFVSTVTAYLVPVVVSPTAVIVAYRNDNSANKDGYICSLLIDETTIAVSVSPKLFNAGSTSYMQSVMLTATKGILVFRDGANSSRGIAIVFRIQGTDSLILGQPFEFTETEATSFSISVLSETKIVIVYCESSVLCGIARVVDIDGMSIVSGERTVLFENGTNASYPAVFPSIALSDTKVLAAYHDDAHGRYGTAQILTCK